MLIPPEKFHQLFTFIRDDASTTGCSVVIFVAPDPDSVCASRILTVRAHSLEEIYCDSNLFWEQNLLQSEFISYSLKPVCGYEYLLEAVEKIQSEEVRISTPTHGY